MYLLYIRFFLDVVEDNQGWSDQSDYCDFFLFELGGMYTF